MEEHEQPSLRVPNPVATATAMIPGVCDLSAFSEDTGNYPNCLVKNKTAPPNKQKNKKHIQDYSRHTQRLRDFETLAAKYSSIIVYHIYVYVYDRVCICAFVVIGASPSVTGPHTPSLAMTTKQSWIKLKHTHTMLTHTLSSCTSSGPFCTFLILKWSDLSITLAAVAL